MIKIRTLIGRKLNYVNGILRRQIELDRYLHTLEEVQLEYLYYEAPLNPIDFISKRYVLFPYYSIRNMNEKNAVNHITFQYLGDLGHFLNRNNTIVTCHDISTFLEKSSFRSPFFIKAYSREGLKKCRYIIAISEFTKQELISKLGIREEKIIVIKNGMNQGIFKPIKNEDLKSITPLYPEFKKILHVGTEIDRKNFLTLLKAFYLLKKKGYKIKLIRVGKPSFKGVIKQLGLEKDVHYLANISNERLNEIYNLCDLFVFPSFYEGWGAPGLEAASAGTPVICSDIPIFREVFQDFPIFFPPKDYKELVNIIKDTLNDDYTMSKMRERGLNVVKKYSWKESSIKYLKLVQKVIND
jgi:glycosyltransferase involved in cell wall biosynthesis